MGTAKGKAGQSHLDKESLRRMVVGIGGDLKEKGVGPRIDPTKRKTQKANRGEKNIDLDLTIVLYGMQRHELLGRINGDNAEKLGREYGIAHSGDGVVDTYVDMDDEFCTIDFEEVPHSVWQIYFIMSIKKKKLTALKGAYARATDQDENELMRFDLLSCEDDGFIIGRCTRHHHTWSYTPIGIYLAKCECCKTIQGIFSTQEKDIRAKSNFLDRTYAPADVEALTLSQRPDNVVATSTQGKNMRALDVMQDSSLYESLQGVGTNTLLSGAVNAGKALCCM